MAGKAKPLTAAQRVAMKQVVDQAAAWREARATAERRIREMVAEDLRNQEMAYALAIREAHDLGIPKRQIGRDGMGTRDPHTLNTWLEKTEGIVAARGGDGVPHFRYDGQNVTVHIPGFETTARGADYPEVLAGVMRPAPEEPTGWAVVQDPDGDLGWFTWEVQQVPRSNPASLTAQVEAWMKENAR